MSSADRSAWFDVSQQHLANVYARALLGAAMPQGVAADVLEELDSLIDDVLDRLPKFEAALASPRIGLPEKLAMLERAFGGQMQPLLLTFLKVVARRGRLDCLRAIRAAAHHRFHEMLGQTEVHVQTARPVSATELRHMEQRLSELLQSRVVLRSSVDENLLGGVVFRIGDTVYDGSLDNQLERMRADALQQTAREARAALQRFAS